MSKEPFKPYRMPNGQEVLSEPYSGWGNLILIPWGYLVFKVVSWIIGS